MTADGVAALRAAAAEQRRLSADARTNNGVAEHEDFADWLEDRANQMEGGEGDEAHLGLVTDGEQGLGTCSPEAVEAHLLAAIKPPLSNQGDDPWRKDIVHELAPVVAQMLAAQSGTCSPEPADPVEPAPEPAGREPRDELFRDFERATDRLERSHALDAILKSVGVEEATYEDIAKFQRWADGYNSAAFDALIAKGWRRTREQIAEPAPVHVEITEARKAVNKLWAGLMAVKPLLDHPYPDDPRWTPWTRFVEDRLANLLALLKGGES